MIPFIDLATQQVRIKPEIDAAIQRVLAHGQYIMGPEVGLLEQALKDFSGSQHCITVSNGTDALIAALMAYDIGPGDAVITTPFTFFATVEAIMVLGATPVFADIDPQTLNICPNQIESTVREVHSQNKLHLRGIIPVDLFGLCADYSRINAIAEQHGLFVIQDAAQAFGASTPDGQKAPTHGHVGTTSFFPAKPLGGYGDGGAIFTDNDDIADKIQSIRMHGQGVDKYDNARIGLNARLDTIQAAVLLEKLKIYSEELDLRQKVAERYSQQMDTIVDSTGQQVIQRQHIPGGHRSAWAQFVILGPHRERIATALKTNDFPSVVYYRTPAQLLKACQGLTQQNNLPVSEAISSRILALPFHPYLNQDSLDHIVETIKNVNVNTCD